MKIKILKKNKEGPANNSVLNEGGGEMLGWMAKQAKDINQTTADEAYQMLLQAVRLFYDDNERLGIVTSVKEYEDRMNQELMVPEPGPDGPKDSDFNHGKYYRNHIPDMDNRYPVTVKTLEIRRSIEHLLRILDSVLKH